MTTDFSLLMVRSQMFEDVRNSLAYACDPPPRVLVLQN